MKILIVRNFPSFFSVENNTYNIQELGLAKALVRKGNSCDIVFWTNNKEEIIDYEFDNDLSLKIYYKHGKTALKNTIFELEDIALNYDVIQTCEYNQIQSWIMAKKYADKLIIYHGPYYSKFNKNYNKMCKIFDLFFVKRYIKNRTHFIVKSKLAKEFLESKGVANVTNIGVGIDSKFLLSEDEKYKDAFFEKIEGYHGIKLLYIGKLEPRRNITFLLEILMKLNEVMETNLFIIGDGNAEYIENIFKLISDKGLENKVVWEKTMEQKYMSNIYQYADYFLLPTYYEIFGMVLLEAMYFKNIVLTTYNGGSSMLINNEENGFILPQNDATSWTEIILKLEKDKEKKKQIGIAARKTIKDSYTWDCLADKFLEEYRKVGK